MFGPPIMDSNIIAAHEHNVITCFKSNSQNLQVHYSNIPLAREFGGNASLELTYLRLEMLYDELGPILPDSFMGRPGATPRLHPGLLKLLSLQLTSSILAFLKFTLPGTLHPRRWPPTSLR